MNKSVATIVGLLYVVQLSVAQFRRLSVVSAPVVCATSLANYSIIVGNELGIPSTVPGEVRCAFRCEKQNKIDGCVGYNYRNGGSTMGTCQLYAQHPHTYSNTVPSCVYFKNANVSRLSDDELEAQYSVIGCFRDTLSRDLPNVREQHDGMSLAYCRNLCYNMNYVYAGAQIGRQCFCANTYGNYGTNGAVCLTVCKGSLEQFCGGSWANTVMRTGRI